MTRYDKLVFEIQKVEDEGVTLEHAERVAGLALSTMNELSELLASSDKDRRMRKQGLKAIKSGVRTNAIKASEGKKPTEGVLEDIVNLDKDVTEHESVFDESEVKVDELTRRFNIAKESHLYFRGVAKGSFNG